MLKVLALQMMNNIPSQAAGFADSAASVTCTGCSCASTVCKSGSTQIADIPDLS